MPEKTVLMNISIPGLSKGDKLVTLMGDTQVLAEIQDVSVQSDEMTYRLVVIAGDDDLLGEEISLPIDRRRPAMMPVIRRTSKEKIVEQTLSLGQLLYLIRNAVGTKSVRGFTYKRSNFILVKDAVVRAMSLGWIPQTSYKQARRHIKKLCVLYPEYVALGPSGQHVHLVTLTKKKVMEELNLGRTKTQKASRGAEIDFRKLAYGLRLILESLGFEVKDD